MKMLQVPFICIHCPRAWYGWNLRGTGFRSLNNWTAFHPYRLEVACHHRVLHIPPAHLHLGHKITVLLGGMPATLQVRLKPVFSVFPTCVRNCVNVIQFHHPVGNEPERPSPISEGGFEQAMAMMTGLDAAVDLARPAGLAFRLMESSTRCFCR